MPEITDQELLTAQRLTKLVQELGTKPGAKAHFQRALKELDPTVVTDEDVAAQITKPYLEEIEALKKRFDDREEADRKASEERAEREALQSLEAKFGRLRDAGVTDEGMEKIKALMQERTIPDPEAAFALFERNNPPAPSEQASYKPQSWNYEGDLMPDSKAWFNDPDGAEEQAIGQVLLEERRRGGSSE